MRQNRQSSSANRSERQEREEPFVVAVTSGPGKTSFSLPPLGMPRRPKAALSALPQEQPLWWAALLAALITAFSCSSDGGSHAPDAVTNQDALSDGVGDSVPADSNAGDLDGIDAADADPPVYQEFVPEPPQGRQWKLLWHDEFNGTLLDDSKWKVEGGTEAEPSPRREGFWVKEAMYLDGVGNLVMATYQKDGKIFDGAISTQGKFEHSYGYYEARMKVSTQPGHWGAFWLMPNSFGATDNGGVDGAEIDIMERPWTDDQMQWTNHALHWDAYAEGADDSKISETPGITEGYHTFGLWWAEDSYTFYIDGDGVWTTQEGGVCTVPLYILFSDEVAAHLFFLSGDIQDATLPDYTYVDYVRVYTLVGKPGD